MGVLGHISLFKQARWRIGDASKTSLLKLVDEAKEVVNHKHKPKLQASTGKQR
jgi:hypothetical protein